MFVSKEEFQSVLTDYCIQQGFSLVVIKSDSKRYTGICSGEKCTWKIHVSRLPDKMTWVIKNIEGFHKTCFFTKKNPMATTAWMCKMIENELISQPTMPAKVMVDFFMSRYGIEVCKRTVYKVRNVTAEKLHGAHEKSYNMLAAYGEIIKSTNPGSWALITWHSPLNDGVTHFKGMFVSFKAWITGFLKGCRPIIGVDGCHLKGRYKGILLSAMNLDGNNNLYCIAYAIVRKETAETWSYFFRNLKLAFQEQGCLKWDWTFISDRMKGVDKALAVEFPLATRICAQHLYTNFKATWGGTSFHNLFWMAANATSFYMYNKAMENIGKLSQAAVAYLSDVPQQWSKHQFDHDVACDHNTSNFVESFNALINEEREKPILPLMEGIRTYYMKLYAERMEMSNNVELAEPTPYAKGTCLCGEWQISGMPCKHACRAIYHNKEEPLHYVHGFFTGQCYKLTYAEHMHPLTDKDQWPTFQFPEVLPPLQERGAGRPKRQRIRKHDDPKPRKGKRSTTITCSICKNLGHNSRSCQGGLTAKQKKEAASIDVVERIGAIGCDNVNDNGEVLQTGKITPIVEASSS